MKNVFMNYLSHYHPNGVITNQDFEKRLETTADWITKNIGIIERNYLKDYRGEYPVFEMCRLAFEKMLMEHPNSMDGVDCIISASTFSDLYYPGPANMLAQKLSLDVPAFNLHNGCTSLIFAIQTSVALIQSQQFKKILIINGEPITLQMDYGDRTSCIIFGDASNSMVLSSDPYGLEIKGIMTGGKGLDLVGSYKQSESSQKTIYEFISGETEKRSNEKIINHRMCAIGKFIQQGPKVKQFVLDNIPSKIFEFLERSSVNKNEVEKYIFHQANLDIMTKLCEQLEIPPIKHLHNITKRGNSASAGWATVLSESHNSSQILPNEQILVTAFGAGMSWGNILFKKVG